MRRGLAPLPKLVLVAYPFDGLRAGRQGSPDYEVCLSASDAGRTPPSAALEPIELLDIGTPR